MNKELYNFYVIDREHRRHRRECGVDFASEFSARGLAPVERMVERFERLLAMETPMINAGERIVLVRTVKDIPDCFTGGEWEKIRSRHFIHELGYL